MTIPRESRSVDFGRSTHLYIWVPRRYRCLALVRSYVICIRIVTIPRRSRSVEVWSLSSFFTRTPSNVFNQFCVAVIVIPCSRKHAWSTQQRCLSKIRGRSLGPLNNAVLVESLLPPNTLCHVPCAFCPVSDPFLMARFLTGRSFLELSQTFVGLTALLAAFPPCLGYQEPPEPTQPLLSGSVCRVRDSLDFLDVSALLLC